ncbi:hypothetical protein HAX54_034458 [Datura stramonium]|uniref:Uncharacterized protein n=1 Tax=Datura stramonium TaxID=4076 RepID=A0ABS8SEG6_DATST|nr:hypothetical protein [Datura stramonium]
MYLPKIIPSGKKPPDSAFLNFQLLKCGLKHPYPKKEASIKHPWTDKYSRDEILFIIDSGKDSTLHPRMARPFKLEGNIFPAKDSSLGQSVIITSEERKHEAKMATSADYYNYPMHKITTITDNQSLNCCQVLQETFSPTHVVVEVSEEKNPIVDTHKSQALRGKEDAGNLPRSLDTPPSELWQGECFGLHHNQTTNLPIPAFL